MLCRVVPRARPGLSWPCCLPCSIQSGSLADMAKSALGKGLGALISSRPALSADAAGGEKVLRVQRDMIVPSPMQPRREFAEEALSDLVGSIREHGIIQPLIVRSVGGRYELIAGERRWRAAQQLALADV